MQTRKFFSVFLAAALLAGSAFPPPVAAAAAAMTSIGVAGAVKGLVKAIPPNPKSPKDVGRIIQSGKPLYLNEHVTTGPGGHLQIMLNDETVFTIGPDSDIVLDQFVYDPATDSGKVVASVSKGVFRFITGNIGKKDPSQMEVKLPAGTIGIRGTIVAGQISPKDGSCLAILLGPGPAVVGGARVGAFDLTNAQGTVNVDRPGFGSTIRADAPPTPPVLVPAEQMKAILGDLAPKTIADRREEGKQMMAERLAQKLSEKEGKEGKEDRKGGEEGRPDGRPLMTEAEQKLAEKMMSGEPLSHEEQAFVRGKMAEEKMPEAERMIAEKMMSGENFTPEEHQKMGMMMAGEMMMEHMGGKEGMTPEQMQFAEKMMAGNMTPEQQQAMMQKMSPEHRAMMEGFAPEGMMGDMMMPPPGMEGGPFRPGDPNMPGNMPPGEFAGPMPEGEFRGPMPEGEFGGEHFGPPPPGAFGGIENFNNTQEFFTTFFQPIFTEIKDPFLLDCAKTNTCPLAPLPGTPEIPTGPSTWDQIRTHVVSGTGHFPGQSGSFSLNMCNGSACVAPTGSWGFSNMVVDFGARTITGTANINASANGGTITINDSATINVNYGAMGGNAVIQQVGSSGFSNYIFGIGNNGGVAAKVMTGNANFVKNAGPGFTAAGQGQELISTRTTP